MAEEDFDNHRRIIDGGDNLQGTAAVGTVFHVDGEDAFEQPGPADARRRALPVSVLAWGLGGRRCRSGNDFTAQLHVRCQHAVEPDQMETRRGTRAARRSMNSSGSMTSAGHRSHQRKVLRPTGTIWVMRIFETSGLSANSST